MDPSLSIKVNDLITRKMRKDHLRGRLNLSGFGRDDESEVSSEVDILPCYKPDPPLYCKPAAAASFYPHLPSQ
jgi:hypothetical protein